MKRLTPWILVLMLLVAGGCRSGGLAMNEFSFVCPAGTEGLRAEAHTLETVLNKFSTHVVTGSVTSFETDPISNFGYYYFSVASVIIGELNQDEIVLRDWPEMLKPGEDYLLFLRETDRNHWPSNYYFFNPEFVFVIDRDGSLMRLEDPLAWELVYPFVESKYNNLAELSKYLVETRDERIFQKHNPPRRHLLESADSLQDLYELSDLVMEIKVTSVHRTSLITAVCDFDVVQVYKGKHPEIDYVGLPGEITYGHYLIFLVTGDVDKGEVGLTLTTRQGSIIAAGTDEYRSVQRWLEDR